MKGSATIIVAAAAGLAGFVGISAYFNGQAQSVAGAVTPATFDEAGGLDAALARSLDEGKPVLALATATWCPPCNMLKKNTLADSEVQSFIAENTVAVSLDDAQHRADIARLGVRAYPTTLVIRDGDVVGTLEGFASKKAYLGFLEANVNSDG
ncbi:MAG: thioredoxin family protein [Planctomycetota bacterium]